MKIAYGNNIGSKIYHNSIPMWQAGAIAPVTGDPYLKVPLTIENLTSSAQSISYLADYQAFSTEPYAQDTFPTGRRGSSDAILYSYDGNTWYTLTKTTGVTYSSIYVPAYGKIMFKCNPTPTIYNMTSAQAVNIAKGWIFKTEWKNTYNVESYDPLCMFHLKIENGSFKAYGNIMSVERSDWDTIDWEDETQSFFGYSQNSRCSNFGDRMFLNSTALIDASKLRLPVKVYNPVNRWDMNFKAYERMFYGCSGLIYPPDYIAYRRSTTYTLGSGSSYNNITGQFTYMFQGCTSLQYVPIFAVEEVMQEKMLGVAIDINGGTKAIYLPNLYRTYNQPSYGEYSWNTSNLRLGSAWTGWVKVNWSISPKGQVYVGNASLFSTQYVNNNDLIGIPPTSATNWDINDGITLNDLYDTATGKKKVGPFPPEDQN